MWQGIAREVIAGKSKHPKTVELRVTQKLMLLAGLEKLAERGHV
jgi:hypothetical protein